MFSIGLTRSEKVRVLERAAVIIETPDRWTTVFFARDESGYSVPVDDPNARSFCVRGAVSRALKELGFTSWEPDGRYERAVSKEIAYHALRKFFPTPRATAEWNNESRHATVVAGVRRTITAIAA